MTRRGDSRTDAPRDQRRERGRPGGLTGQGKGRWFKAKVIWAIRAVSSGDCPVIEISVQLKAWHGFVPRPPAAVCISTGLNA